MNQPIAMNTTRKHVVWLDVVRLVGYICGTFLLLLD